MKELKIEKSSGNVFANIGLAEPDERLAKAELAIRIAQIVKKRHLTQQQAADILEIPQPKVSAILNGQLRGFSLEKLLRLMMSLDRDIEIVVRKKPRDHEHGQMKVTYV
jgi:predicted XRE-type DNA-binding protein